MSGKTAIVPQGRKSPLTVQDVARMSGPDKLGEAIRRSLPYVPADMRQLVESMLEPQTLAAMAAVFAVWGAAHFFGAGFFIDYMIGLYAMFITGGFIFAGAAALYNFGKMALNARSDAELENAGRHFSRAVVILGPTILNAVFWLKAHKYYLTHPESLPPETKRGKPVSHGKPYFVPVEQVMTQNTLHVIRPATLPGGQAMLLRSDGLIMVARNQPLSAQKRALFQAIARRYLLPRALSLQRFRAQISATGYERLALLRYLELVLADGYAQLRLHGLTGMLSAIRFPLQSGHVTVSQLAIAGHMVGTITLNGTLLYVYISYEGVWDDTNRYGATVSYANLPHFPPAKPDQPSAQTQH